MKRFMECIRERKLIISLSNFPNQWQIMFSLHGQLISAHFKITCCAYVALVSLRRKSHGQEK